ncbi:glycosyltransferase family 39 protein [Streptomyces sp. DH10]|uniref:glycosyltransferase family 39 protein n=1 Tax=Streptomyces sp. DH10 TaxID=3040121 RepID=UPI0024429EA4|nr:glycosyltransferase family 39 protein [Streptomyces sp. DH10]MDG9713466.1 glycosyltransferase family 39 protein [Streptomyces sp. DH10]
MAVMLAVGLWGLDRGGMWGDESVTFQVAQRTVPQIWRLLHDVDAVHGLYYLLMHAVLAVHPDEVVLRLPSVCAAAATAGLVAALGVRLSGPRVGLWAGLLYAITPMTGHYAQEGRSYTLVAAGVAGATLLLLRAVEAVTARAWWPYGTVVALTCLLHELAVLALCAHAATLALMRVPRRAWSGWGRAAGAVVLLLLPLVWVSQGQSGQVAWLVTPGWDEAERLVRHFCPGPAGVVCWASLLLTAVGLRTRRLAAVALPLLLVPPGILMTVSQVRPLFHGRYVLYSLAGASLLVAAGAGRVAGVLGRLRFDGRRVRVGGRRVRALLGVTGVLALTVTFVHHLPVHRQDRSAAHRPDNLAVVSALALRQMRPGDPVLFVPSVGRLAALAYPKGFRQVRDIALRESAPRSGTLWGREATPAELRHRLASVDRVWTVAETYALDPRWSPRDPVERTKLAVLAGEFTVREEHARGGVILRLHVRRAPADAPATDEPSTGVATAGEPFAMRRGSSERRPSVVDRAVPRVP